jgi:hypothetical protein
MLAILLRGPSARIGEEIREAAQQHQEHREAENFSG